MYHIGKVIKIFKKQQNDFGVQATLEMWDENILTLEVDKKITKELKENSFVLVDYRPIPGMAIVQPQQIVRRVLDSQDALALWELYRQRLERIKRAAKEQRVTGIQDVYR